METVNLIRSLAAAIEGQEYYFLSGQAIEQGTCVRCEKCNKACAANAHKILSFNQKTITITINEEMRDAQELGYDEETEQCLCEDCN